MDTNKINFFSRCWSAFIFCGLLMIMAPGVLAQDEPALTIRLSRDWGAAVGGRIQGTFSVRVTGPDNLERVVFYIDGERMGEDNEPPFRLQFLTDSYPTGPHTFTVTGFTRDGQELTSNEIRATFMSASDSQESLTRVMIPLIVGLALFAVIVPLGIAIASKRQKLAPGATRHYGVAGGAICPRCQRAYPRHFFSPNLFTGKLERCPFCGKWAVVAAASPEKLAAAEAAERQSLHEHVADSPISPEEKLRRRLDDSRFDSE
ncbi:MAG: hypothetical protein KJ063_19340 [Anaerolineae bacterium]|nr:hypothetical protein [Anaerolineae bacterium]